MSFGRRTWAVAAREGVQGKTGGGGGEEGWQGRLEVVGGLVDDGKDDHVAGLQVLTNVALEATEWGIGSKASDGGWSDCRVEEVAGDEECGQEVGVGANELLGWIVLGGPGAEVTSVGGWEADGCGSRQGGHRCWWSCKWSVPGG
jgi:hypothetical protein